MWLNNSGSGRRWHNAAFALLCLFTASSVQAQEPEQGKFDDIEAYIDGTIEAQMVLKDIPAVTVSVVKDGKRIFSKGYGMADREQQRPVDPATSTFRIGSTSKLFTWTSVMQLYEQGKVDLDADVNTYLDFKIPDTFKEPITLRHILTHTAGFEDGGLGYLIQYYPNHGVPLAEAMEKYIPRRLNPPGKVSSYSNYATALAGLIVQNVSGMPFNEYVKTHILQPLEMQHTTFDEPLSDDMEKQRVKGYTREAGVFAEQPFEMIDAFGPAGAVSASANDMSHFMLAHLNNGEYNGKRILKEDTAKLMHSALWQGDKRLSAMAHGFYEHHFNGHRLIGHGGDTMQFHTDMLIDHDEQFGIFVSYQTTTDNQARNVFVKQFYDHYFPAEKETLTPPKDFASRADKYAGTYIFWRRNESTIEKAIGIFGGGTEIVPTENNTLLVAGIFPARQYVEIDTNLFQQVDGDEKIAFVEDENGEITALYYDSLPFMGLEPLPAFQSGLFRVFLPLVSILLFAHILISWGYKRQAYRAASPVARKLYYAAIANSAVNLLFIVLFMVIVLTYQDALYSGLPFVFKLNLVLPVLAVILSLLTAWFYVKRQTSEKTALASTIYYGMVVIAGLYMAYFYYYWNILGWNYK